jgi:hypothetical protein
MLGLSSLSSATRTMVWRAAGISVVTLGLLLVAWRYFGASAQLASVDLSPLPILLAVLGSGMFIVGRAWRFRHLLDGRAGFVPLLAAVGVSWGAGLLLPGPSADATFVVLVRRRLGVGARRGTSVSILARLLDVISLALVVVVSASLSDTREPDGAVIATAAVGGAMLIGLGVALHGRGRSLLVRGLSRFARTRPWAGAVDDALAELGRPHKIALLCASTAVCRVATLMQYAALFSMLGLHVGLWVVWFVLAVRTFLSTIPIQGLAGLGTGQIWWTSALVLAGVGAGAAVGISITLSLLDLAVSFPVVLACWALWRATAATPVPEETGDAVPAVTASLRGRRDTPQEVDVVS